MEILIVFLAHLNISHVMQLTMEFVKVIEIRQQTVPVHKLENMMITQIK